MTSSPAVPGRRSYRSPLRQQQAAETRMTVLAAATRLFGEHGWSSTGMRDVAKEAGVAVETVYANFGSKTDLLMAAIDAGVVGDVDPVPLADRPEFTALSKGSVAGRVAAAARLVTGIQVRTAGLQRALREAAASEPDIAARVAEDEHRRRDSVHQAAELLTGRSVSDHERDVLWAVLSVDVFDLLTELSGWSVQQYEAWVARVIAEFVRKKTTPAAGRRRTT